MLKRLAILSALVVGTASFANAATISQISIIGSNNFTISGSSGTITFLNPAIIGGTPTGNFAPTFTSGNLVTMFPGFTGALPFALGFQTVQSRIGVPSVLAMQTIEGGVTLDFFLTDYSVAQSTGACGIVCLNITGDGFYTETGFPQMPGAFTFTTQATDAVGDTNVTFSGTGYETPEPASLMLLGTGMLGVVGIARRKLLRV
jgi:hypothetical protein